MTWEVQFDNQSQCTEQKNVFSSFVNRLEWMLFCLRWAGRLLHSLAPLVFQ